MKKNTIKRTTKAIRKYNLDQPTQIVTMAKVLKKYIVENKLYAEIAGKNYVMVEGWQFAGGLLGLFPRVVKVESVGENKWLAHVEIINKKDERVVSSGFALCSKAEMKKKSFDEYAILSMAQTRAIGKAYRNLIGWIMKLSGYEATPAEEIKPIIVSATTSKPVKEKEGADDVKKINELKSMLKGSNNQERLADLKKKTGINLGSFNITGNHARVLIASLLNLETK